MLIARDYSRKSVAKLLLFLQTRKYFVGLLGEGGGLALGGGLVAQLQTEGELMAAQVDVAVEALIVHDGEQE